MDDAVSEYERHRHAPDHWALGRFVAPLSRWDELSNAVRKLPDSGAAWPVSILASPADVDRIRSIRAIGDEHLVVDAVESRAESVAEAGNAAGLVRLGIDVFVEVNVSADLDAIAAELSRIGAAAKLRTGGVVATAFPESRHVLSFLRACQSAGIRFKATAGLHHAVRGEYRLTYEPVPPTGVMFGFLNVALAAALLWFGRDDDIVLAALEERSPASIELTDAGVSWRNERLTIAQLDEVRSEFFVGFGSCSFREPMAEIGLEALPRA